jgi:hypothetical protein
MRQHLLRVEADVDQATRRAGGPPRLEPAEGR